MTEKEIVVVSSMLLKEISPVLGEIQQFISASFLNTTEGKLREIALKATNSLFKATIDSRPLGIIFSAEGSVVKMDAWMSNKELRESWASAINSVVKQIFFNPVAGKIEWRITSSNKDMLEIAKACGFRKEGELSGEGLSRETLIVMGLPRTWSVSLSAANTAAEIAEKDKTIKAIEFQLKQKDNLINNLEAALVDAAKKLKEAETRLVPKETDGKIDTSTTAKISELEAANRQLGKENAELKSSVDEKIGHIAEQAKIIEELQKSAYTAAPKEEALPVSTEDKELEKKIPDDKDKGIENNPADDETEIETTPPKMAIEELEKLISKILYPVPREMLKWIILQPGIGYPELAKKADTSANYVSIKAGQFAKLGLIVRRHKNPANHRLVSLYPAKGVIQKLQEMAKNRQENPETKQKEVAEETPPQKETEKPAEPLTPFQKMVQIVKELAKNNGSGIETDELHKIAAEKGLTKDEAASTIRGLKREQVLTAWGNSTFLQISRENLAKI